jgi:hypothetical protein
LDAIDVVSVTNRDINHCVERLDATRYKTYRIYQKTLRSER